MLTGAVVPPSAGPVIWTALGYPFEAGAMVAALLACLTVRLWVLLGERPARVWTVDLTISLLALLFTAGWVMLQRPSPFYALLGGTGFAALGAGVITIALAWVKRITPLARPDADRVIQASDEPVQPGKEA